MAVETFAEELRRSGYLHRPLPLHEETTREARLRRRAVLDAKTVWTPAEALPTTPWQGVAEWAEQDGKKVVWLHAPRVCKEWPYGMPQDGNCSYYGQLRAKFAMGGADWSGYDRVRVRLYTACQGSRIVEPTLCLVNDEPGDRAVPDKFNRTGFTTCEMKNFAWTDWLWDIPELSRANVQEIEFRFRIGGKEVSDGDTVNFYIAEIAVERTEEPEKETGWAPRPGRLHYAQAGYRPGDPKLALVAPEDLPEDGAFTLTDENGNVVYTGEAKSMTWKENGFATLDFSDFTAQGRYRLQVGLLTSKPFPIAEDANHETVWQILNFIYCERCGCPVPGKHGLCHMDIYARHNGLLLPFGGGWHDAGDMSQQAAQTAETTQVLLQAALSFSNDTMLSERLWEEALWGLEFTLRTRFGDGVRASSLGLIRWTDNKIGSADDADNVRTQGQAMINLIDSQTEAMAALALPGRDDGLAWKCGQVAEEDFAFAMERWEKYGVELPSKWEHTYNASRCLHYAEIVRAAALLYQLTKKEGYAKTATEYADKLMACQQDEPSPCGVVGFFYRDESHKRLIHYNHQAREHLPVLALTELIKALPGNPACVEWKRSVKLFGEYIRSLAAYASPYGMLPAGVYQENEIEDRETFALEHLQSDYETEKPNYLAELRNGDDLGNGWWLRQFPVWFSFRGNSAIQLTLAAGAALTSQTLKEKDLKALAVRQAQWFGGCNPFAASLIYGAGQDSSEPYAIFPGKTVGAVAVGIQTKGNSDEPNWPNSVCATYKEVWMTAAADLLQVLSLIE